MSISTSTQVGSTICLGEFSFATPTDIITGRFEQVQQQLQFQEQHVSAMEVANSTAPAATPVPVALPNPSPTNDIAETQPVPQSQSTSKTTRPMCPHLQKICDKYMPKLPEFLSRM